MKVFVSHASEQRAEADRLAIALRARRHTVFLDVDDLPASGDYQSRIQHAIEECDLFCFLISPHSVTTGRFTLSELGFVRRRWPDPTGRVVPIMVVKVPIDSVPPYLRAVSILEPQGDVVADSLAAIEALRPARSWRSLAALGAVGLALLLAAGSYVYSRHPFKTDTGSTRQVDGRPPVNATGQVSLEWNGSSSVEWEVVDADGKTLEKGLATAKSTSRVTAPNGDLFVILKALPEVLRLPVRVVAGEVSTVTPAIGQLEVRWNGPDTLNAKVVDEAGSVLRENWSVLPKSTRVTDFGPGRYFLVLPNRKLQPVTVLAGTTAVVSLEAGPQPPNPRPSSRPPLVPYMAGQWKLPSTDLMGFVEIPAGTFLMGSDRSRDRSALQDEQPQHQVSLLGFFIGRYEVTVDQYKACVDDGICKPGTPSALSGAANLPVRHVSWREAVAYCEWLDGKLRSWSGTPGPVAAALRGARDGRRWQVRLPTEAEWEKAARGTDGRTYPWGDVVDATKANYEDSKLGQPTQVGQYPSGASAYGLQDMAGNVWEWTRSRYLRYPYRPDDGREDVRPGKTEARVIRGGSFQTADVRAARRNWGNEGERTDFTGFRVAVGPAAGSLP